MKFWHTFGNFIRDIICLFINCRKNATDRPKLLPTNLRTREIFIQRYVWFFYDKFRWLVWHQVVSTPGGFIKLNKICENQTWCSLIFADLLQIVETVCIKLVGKKSWQSTCSKTVDNMQQTCYHQAGASDVNASCMISAWWRQGNMRVSGCVLLTRLWTTQDTHSLVFFKYIIWTQALFII